MNEPDRSKWRYEDGGAPIDAADHFLGLLRALTRERLRGESISGRLEELRALVTEESWPNFQHSALEGFGIPW